MRAITITTTDNNAHLINECTTTCNNKSHIAHKNAYADPCRDTYKTKHNNYCNHYGNTA